MSMSKLGRSLTFLALALAACGGEGASNDPPGALQRSALERELSPAVSAEDRESLRRGATDFALELHRRVAAEGGNTVLSPHSIQVAFGMLRPGALGTTADEIDAALGWELPPERLLPALNHLDLELAARNGEGVTLAIANQSWAQVGYPFEPSYLDQIAVHFGAGVAEWNFGSDPEGGRTEINGWVSARTAENIPELLAEGLITEYTKLVLVNAVHFDGAWEIAFDPANTADGSFLREDGSVATVPLMNVTLEGARFASVAGASAAELPYAGGELAMLVIRPSGSLAELEAELDAAALDAIVDALAPVEKLPVAMPRFTLGSDVNLAEVLPELGMQWVFTDAAELEGISTASNLFVSAAVHAATIEVSEAGTEASAATAIVVSDRSGGPTMRLDRPFLFAIRDRATGAILFLGRVADPA